MGWRGLLRLFERSRRRRSRDYCDGSSHLGDDNLSPRWAPEFVMLLDVFEDVLDFVGGPEELFAFDGEGWGEADDVVVRLLAEDAFAHEGFADGAGGGGELDCDPETPTTDFDDVRTVDLLETIEEEGA